jgi:hypothetical protein
MGGCPRSPAAPAQAVDPSSLSRSPTRSQWTRLFGRHTPYERFDSGHRHGLRDRFGDGAVVGALLARLPLTRGRTHSHRRPGTVPLCRPRSRRPVGKGREAPQGTCRALRVGPAARLNLRYALVRIGDKPDNHRILALADCEQAMTVELA